MLQDKNNGVQLKIYVQPGASKTEWAGVYNQAYKLRVQAPPTDGKANKALIKFIAKFFKVPASHIQVLKGQASRNKLIFIQNLDLLSAQQILETVVSERK